MKSTRELLRQRQIETLELTSRLGWICAPVLSYAFWTQAPARRKYAERLIASIVKRGWLEKVKGTTPTAYTVTRTGKADYEFFTDLGGNPASLNRPIPPGPTYRHDIRAASALLYMAKGDTQRVIFDREIKAANAGNKARKRPDGIVLSAVNPREGYWVEVENSRKTGPNMKKLVNEIIEITMAEGKGGHWLNASHGKVSPFPCLVMVVPEKYGMDAFRQRVQEQLDFDDKGERATFWFIQDTKDGFVTHNKVTLKPSEAVESW